MTKIITFLSIIALPYILFQCAMSDGPDKKDENGMTRLEKEQLDHQKRLQLNKILRDLKSDNPLGNLAN